MEKAFASTVNKAKSQQKLFGKRMYSYGLEEGRQMVYYRDTVFGLKHRPFTLVFYTQGIKYADTYSLDTSFEVMNVLKSKKYDYFDMSENPEKLIYYKRKIYTLEEARVNIPDFNLFYDSNPVNAPFNYVTPYEKYQSSPNLKNQVWQAERKRFLDMIEIKTADTLSFTRIRNLINEKTHGQETEDPFYGKGPVRIIRLEHIRKDGNEKLKIPGDYCLFMIKSDYTDIPVIPREQSLFSFEMNDLGELKNIEMGEKNLPLERIPEMDPPKNALLFGNNQRQVFDELKLELTEKAVKVGDGPAVETVKKYRDKLYGRGLLGQLQKKQKKYASSIVQKEAAKTKIRNKILSLMAENNLDFKNAGLFYKSMLTNPKDILLVKELIGEEEKKEHENEINFGIHDKIEPKKPKKYNTLFGVEPGEYIVIKRAKQLEYSFIKLSRNQHKDILEILDEAAKDIKLSITDREIIRKLTNKYEKRNIEND